MNSDPSEISSRSDSGKGEEDFYLFPHLLLLVPPTAPNYLLVLLVDYKKVYINFCGLVGNIMLPLPFVMCFFWEMCAEF